jgi:hypothetical protein
VRNSARLLGSRAWRRLGRRRLEVSGNEKDVLHERRAEAGVEPLAKALLHKPELLHPTVCRDGDEKNAVAQSRGLRPARDGLADLLVPERPQAIAGKAVLGIDTLQHRIENRAHRCRMPGSPHAPGIVVGPVAEDESSMDFRRLFAKIPLDRALYIGVYGQALHKMKGDNDRGGTQAERGAGTHGG